MTLPEIVGYWLLSFMVFNVNPLNDRTNPESRLNYYHLENIEGRRALEMMIEKEGGDKDIVISWAEVWLYLFPTLMTAGCVLIDLLFKG